MAYQVVSLFGFLPIFGSPFQRASIEKFIKLSSRSEQLERRSPQFHLRLIFLKLILRLYNNILPVKQVEEVR